jgi:thiamine pyrophosphokinase
MRAVVFLNGIIDDDLRCKKLIHPDDKIFCADGGAAHAFRLGLVPERIVGDFDSLDPSLSEYFSSQGVAFDRFVKGKNQTDGELLLSSLAQTALFAEVLIFGAVGGRTAHMFANILLLEHFAQSFRNITIISGSERIECVTDQKTLTDCQAFTVSFLPLSEISTISLRGFLYPLENHAVHRGESLCISNVVFAREAQVTVHQGKILMIIEDNI